MLGSRQVFRPAAFLKRDSNTGFPLKLSKLLRTSFFTEHLRWLLLRTGIHGNTNFFERCTVLRGGRDHTWMSYFRDIIL